MKTNLFLVIFFYSINLYIANCQIATDEIIDEELKTISQDCNNYIDQLNNPLINVKISTIKNSFLKKYQLPWSNPSHLIETKSVKKLIKSYMVFFENDPGWGINKKKIKIESILDIKRNMDMENFPNIDRPGISIKDTNMKYIPTHIPSFSSWTKPGENYPFDNIQNSYLQAFEPIHIYHVTLNGEWCLVLDGRKSCSWVRSTDIAYVSQEFISNWTNNNFIVPIQDDQPIRDINSKKFITKARVGQLLPVLKENKTNFEILYVSSDYKGNAHINKGTITKHVVVKFPLKFTNKNIAKIANNFIGSEYDWGGRYGFRDCSSLLRDIYSVFGIFLPRKSTEQQYAGNRIDLSNLSKDEKIEKINEVGVPFLSIIWMNGHSFLYIGSVNDVPYVYHNIWGFKTVTDDIVGRAVFGRTVIMPIDFIHSNYSNIPSSFLKRIQSITTIHSEFIDETN